MLRQILVLAHLLGAIVWVGGMCFAYACLRPAAAQHLAPAQRLTLWVAAYRRFFRLVVASIVLIWCSGMAMVVQTGASRAPLGWQLMAVFALAMTAGFGHVRAVLYPRLCRQVDAGDLPAAAATLNAIRRWVALNLVLSAGTLVAAVAAR